MATAIIPSGTGTQTKEITINNLVKNWNNMTPNQQANNYVKFKNKLNNKLTQEQKNKVIKYIKNKLTQKQENKVNFKPFTGVGRRLINVNPTISKTDLLMMAKFISFNKMTRLGMKNAGNYEMAFYDYLVNFFVQTAKAANRPITREQLQGSLKNEMRKITRTKITRTNNRHRVPAIMRTGTRPNNRFSATMRPGGVPIRVA